VDKVAAPSAGDGVATSRNFWAEFAEHHWERKAALLTGAGRAAFPVIGASDLFAVTCECIDEFCKRGAPRVRFYVGGREADVRRSQSENLLPTARDGSFEEYNLRLGQRIHGADYAIIIADWHPFARPFWELLLRTIEDLSSVVGITPTWIDTQIFFGNYKVTPFGVHEDRTSAFHFPVVGRKVMRFWDDSFVRQNPKLNGAKHYEEFEVHSQVVSAEAGEGIYWPSDHWHVAESDGGFAATWSTGYWIDSGLRETAIRLAQQMIRGADRKASPVWPAKLMESPSAIVDQFYRDAFRLQITEVCLRYLSAFGFRQVPGLLNPPPVSAGTMLRRKDGFPLLISTIPGGQLCVAAGGYSRRFADSPEIHDLVSRLNAGEGFAMEKFDAEFLHFCLSVGALAGA
jgi:hypothetical protein